MINRPELLLRARMYCDKNGLILADSLGTGRDGSIFAVENQTKKGISAIKSHEREGAYRRERDVYLRLKECEISDVRGCAVPQLLHYDDELWIIEMTVVSRPFVLDFADAFLDEPPDFSEEVLADWRVEKQEQFGPRWSEVQAILRFLEGYGVFMLDANPGNISFGD